MSYPPLDSDSPLLPKFEHIYEKVCAIWGSHECRFYLNKLLSESRKGTRAGFPAEVAKEIYRLLHSHDLEYPEHSHVPDPEAFTSLPMPTRRTPKEERRACELCLLWIAVVLGVLYWLFN